MGPDKVVGEERHGDGVAVFLGLLRNAVRQSSKPTAILPSVEVEPLDVASRHQFGVGATILPDELGADHFRRRVPPCRPLLMRLPEHLQRPSEVAPREVEALPHSPEIGGNTVGRETIRDPGREIRDERASVLRRPRPNEPADDNLAVGIEGTKGSDIPLAFHGRVPGFRGHERPLLVRFHPLSREAAKAVVLVTLTELPDLGHQSENRRHGGPGDPGGGANTQAIGQSLEDHRAAGGGRLA
jgi:hypothetical protein